MASVPPRIILDVSLTLNLRGLIASGIPRVEENVAAALLRRTDVNAAFCRYRSRNSAFQYVPAQEMRETLQQPRVRTAPYQAARKQTPLRRLGKAIERGWRRYLFPPSNLIRWSQDDVYVSVGAWWNAAYDEAMGSLFGKVRVRKVLMCHDTIPLQFPNYFEDSEAHIRFHNGLARFSSADLVLCNSQMTERDLLAALDSAGLPRPMTIVVPLPPGISPQSEKPHCPVGMVDGDFALTVGSVSQRKNQIMLCDIWSSLADDPAMAGVKLVMAGAWGEHSAAVRERLRHDPKLAERVIVRNDITDGELAWLYQHCLFTLFPSFYEGWGLPVCESLSFGKLCIASDTSAMPEAGGGLCLHLSPSDPESWYKAITELLLNPSLLAAYEKEIASGYRPNSWDDVVEGVIGSVR